MQLQPAHLPATRGASAGHPPAGFSEKGSGSKHTSSIVLNGFFTTLELSLSSSSTSVQTPDQEGGYRSLSETSCEKAGNFGSIKTRSVPGFPPPWPGHFPLSSPLPRYFPGPAPFKFKFQRFQIKYSGFQNISRGPLPPTYGVRCRPLTK